MCASYIGVRVENYADFHQLVDRPLLPWICLPERNGFIADPGRHREPAEPSRCPGPSPLLLDGGREEFAFSSELGKGEHYGPAFSTTVPGPVPRLFAAFSSEKKSSFSTK